MPKILSNVPREPSPQMKPVLTWMSASEDLDIDRLSAVMSDESFQDNILPTSLGFPACTSKAAWVELFNSGIASWFDKNAFEYTLHEHFEGPSHVTAHIGAKGVTKGGELMTNEFLIVFQLREYEKGVFKIVRILEFADSLNSSIVVRTEPTEDWRAPEDWRGREYFYTDSDSIAHVFRCHMSAVTILYPDSRKTGFECSRPSRKCSNSRHSGYTDIRGSELSLMSRRSTELFGDWERKFDGVRTSNMPLLDATSLRSQHLYRMTNFQQKETEFIQNNGRNVNGEKICIGQN